MKRLKILYLFTFLPFLVGCAQPATPFASSTPLVETTANPSPTPTYTLAPTSVATFKPVPFEVRSFCPQINTNADAIPPLNGTIVLAGKGITFRNENYSAAGGGVSSLLFWNTIGDEVKTYPLPARYEHFYFATSPDRRHLAFTKGKTFPSTTEVFILSVVGLEEAKFTLPNDWTLFDWMNDEQLLVRQSRLVGENLDLIAINPFTNEQRLLPSDFPNFYSKETLVSWGALTIFSQDDTLVVYPIRTDHIQAVLWDVSANKEIARVDGSSGPESPRWSLDGSRLLMVVETGTDRFSDEIYVVSKQGEIVRSTFFNNHLEKHRIDLPAWSPDGRYIAFWVSENNQAKNARLAVLDLVTSKVDLYCMEVDAFPFHFGEGTTLGFSYRQVNAASPIWSPDGKFILIEDQQSFDVDNTYLFDLQNHTIALLAKNASPVSWMINP